MASRVRGKGITYDTGFVLHTENPRQRFQPVLVERELRIIRDDPYCTAVRLTGGDPARIELAARFAVDLGLEVWFSPYPLELTTGEMLSLFADCAERAEQLRRQGGEVVFVTGAELYRWTALTGRRSTSCPLTSIGRRRSQTNSPGGSAPPSCRESRWPSPSSAPRPSTARVIGALADSTSSSTTTRAPVRLDGEYVRDEDGQAAYPRELLEAFDSEHVDSNFVFIFALRDHPHRPGGTPHEGLDLASHGIVKVFDDRRGDTYPEMPWEPKAAFAAVAEYYRDH